MSLQRSVSRNRSRGGILGPVLVLLTLLAPAIGRPQAAPTAYQVEIIVFSTGGGAAQREDAGGQGVRAARSTDSGERSSGAAQASRLLGLLPASQLKLTAMKQSLAASGSYRPIAHAGWTQSAASWGARSGIPLQSLGIAVPGLSGQVQLERGSYLHLGSRCATARAAPARLRRSMKCAACVSTRNTILTTRASGSSRW